MTSSIYYSPSSPGVLMKIGLTSAGILMGAVVYDPVKDVWDGGDPHSKESLPSVTGKVGAGGCDNSFQQFCYCFRSR